MNKKSEKSRKLLENFSRTSREVGPYLGIGLQLAASILIFLYLGKLVDGKLGTYPLFMLIGAFVGAAGGMINFIRTVIKAEEKSKEKNDKI